MITSRYSAVATAAIVFAGCAAHDDRESTASTSASVESAPTVPNQIDAVPLELVGPPVPQSEVYVTLESSDVACEQSCIGTFWLQELNGQSPPRNVRMLDLSGLAPGAIQMAAGAGAGELVFRGEFSPGSFFVHEAWRGLPGVAAPPLAVYSAVETFDGQLVAQLLGGPWGHPIKDVSVDGLARSWVDPDWISGRVMAHGAIVAGTFNGWTLDAAQVFVELPLVVGPCVRLRLPPPCDEDEVMTYRLDDNLCQVPTGCAKPGFCPELLERCDPGYAPLSVPSQPNACPVMTCEPAFALQ
jgi:hypothetical protein